MAREKANSGPAKKVPSPVPSRDTVPTSYALALDQLKARIRLAQLKAAVSVSRDLIELYLDIGKQIVERQQAESWGRIVVYQLARALQHEFQGVASFSSNNV